MVTNAQYPEKIKNIKIVTQLYISLDSPTKEKAKDIGKPLFPDYWERLLSSLDEMKKKKFRTTLRMTMIKGMNMDEEDMAGYKKLVERASPNYIEIKGYMFVGASRQRLSIGNMPYHKEVREFSEEFVKLLSDYEIIDEQESSRVVLLAKKGNKGKTWIDFSKFFQLLKEKNPEDILAEEYTTSTQKVPEPRIQEVDLD